MVADAGVMILGPITGADTTGWRRMIELNTLGLMYTAHAAAPHLLPLQNRADVQGRMYERYSTLERLRPADVADVIAFILTRPRRVAVNEVLVRPTEQQG